MDRMLSEIIKIRELLEVIAGEKAQDLKKLEVSDELRKEIREWRSIQVRATIEGKPKQQEAANKFRDSICKKHGLAIADLVDIAEGRERKSDDDEQP